MFSFTRFLAKFATTKAEDGARGLMSALVRIDPKAASEAELKIMEENVDKAGELVRQFRRDFEQEQAEALAAEKRFADLLAACEVLRAQIDDPNVPEARKAGLTASMERAVKKLEELEPEVHRERAEAEGAHKVLEEADAQYQELVRDLAEARGRINAAMRDMQQAKIAEDRAKADAERAAKLAGLREGSGDKIGSALKTFEDEAQRARGHAEVLRTKAQILGKTTEEDANLTAALASVQTKALPGSTIGDRLAALKARQGDGEQTALPAPKP
jgi:chromosome segregation ATPase